MLHNVAPDHPWPVRATSSSTTTTHPEIQPIQTIISTTRYMDLVVLAPPCSLANMPTPLIHSSLHAATVMRMNLHSGTEHRAVARDTGAFLFVLGLGVAHAVELRLRR